MHNLVCVTEGFTNVTIDGLTEQSDEASIAHVLVLSTDNMHSNLDCSAMGKSSVRVEANQLSTCLVFPIPISFHGEFVKCQASALIRRKVAVVVDFEPNKNRILGTTEVQVAPIANAS